VWGVLKSFHQLATAFGMIVIRVLAFGIGMMDDQAKTRPRVLNRGVFQHRLVAITVTKASNWPPTNELVDADRLAVLVVDKQVDVITAALTRVRLRRRRPCRPSSIEPIAKWALPKVF
jgi:hypothetical protein